MRSKGFGVSGFRVSGPGKKVMGLGHKMAVGLRWFWVYTCTWGLGFPLVVIG